MGIFTPKNTFFSCFFSFLGAFCVPLVEKTVYFFPFFARFVFVTNHYPTKFGFQLIARKQGKKKRTKIVRFGVVFYVFLYVCSTRAAVV